MTVPVPTPAKTAPTPLQRWLRTAQQAAATFVTCIPTMAAAFNVSAEKSAKYSLFVTAMLTSFSALHNVWDARKGNG